MTEIAVRSINPSEPPPGYVGVTEAVRRLGITRTRFERLMYRDRCPIVYDREKGRWWVPVKWLEEQGA